jgi:hypothetical protein
MKALVLIPILGWAVGAAAQDDRSTISLNSEVIDARGPRPAVPARLAARADDGSDGYVLVKFPGPVSAAQLRQLRAATERVYTYLPHDTFLVKMSPEGRAGLKQLGASWSDAYHPAYKLSRFLAAVAPDPSALAPESPLIVMVQAYPDADLERLVRILEERGLKVVGSQESPFFSRIRLLAAPGEIARHREAIVRIPEVFWADVEPRRVMLNDTTVWVGQSGLSGGQTTPIFSQGIFGEGQVVGVLDTGIDPDMCYFRDPARGLPPRNECNGGTAIDANQRKVLAVDFLWGTECAGGIGATEWDTQNHGSHVAGTVAGDNFATPLIHDPGDGMAPGAKLVIQDCGFQTNNCADCPGIGCPVVDLNPIFQQTYTQGARLHTNSWGDQENASPQNNYTTGSQDVDEFMWNHKDFLIFFAAGNSGPGTATVGSPSTAKSAVSVGATLRGTSANSMASFSSCGPTDDGRIKPEVTIPGSGIISAANDRNITSNNCNTRSMSGTSMASPGAAGLTALIRQYYADGWYPSGREVSANGFTPSAALLRATLVNSAASMTGATAIPSNCQGWGRVLLENALFFDGQPRKLFVRDNAPAFVSGSTGESRVFTLSVAAGQSLKATLAWTDFPSTPAANPHLNNDLDLVVSGPSGTFRGNVFSGGASTAGGSADRRNTLEQVLINAPAAGTYTFTVSSFTVPSGPQPFALVVTGDVTEGTTPPAVVFEDDFETNKGWTVNPNATDTATTGRWERGDPEATNSNGPKQLGTTISGVNDLVTARLAGASAGVNDIDGGMTSIQSPAITLPATGTLTLTFRQYLAHGSNSSSADFLRVSIVGTTTTTVFQRLGAAADVDGAWSTATASLNAFAGQTVRIRIEAADAAGASLVEAGVDDVRVTRQ